MYSFKFEKQSSGAFHCSIKNYRQNITYRIEGRNGRYTCRELSCQYYIHHSEVDECKSWYDYSKHTKKQWIATLWKQFFKMLDDQRKTRAEEQQIPEHWYAC